MRVSLRLVVGILFLFSLGVSAQYPEQNVNMVAGTQWPGGDPFLRQQNEPSVAVSTRNPLHLLAGANDYRSVDIPFNAPPRPDGEETGDAWLGVFKSLDGGNRWRAPCSTATRNWRPRPPRSTASRPAQIRSSVPAAMECSTTRASY